METQKIFNQLANKGLESYREEYRQNVGHTGMWKAAGLALAGISDSRMNILHLVYSFLEDHNYHSLCSVLNWVANLYPTSYYMDDLKNIQYEMMNRGEVLVNVTRNDDGSWTQKKYRCIVKFEEVK